MSNTQDIAKAAKELSKLERKMAKLEERSVGAIEKATNKAKKLYGQKIVDAQNAVDASKLALQNLAAAA